MALTASWFLPSDEFLLALELDEELGAVVVGREEVAVVADQQAAAAGDFVHQGLHVRQDVLGRLVAAVVVDRDGPAWGCRRHTTRR